MIILKQRKYHISIANLGNTSDDLACTPVHSPVGAEAQATHDFSSVNFNYILLLIDQYYI